jgi:hypothetical protein
MYFNGHINHYYYSGPSFEINIYVTSSLSENVEQMTNPVPYVSSAINLLYSEIMCTVKLSLENAPKIWRSNHYS